MRLHIPLLAAALATLSPATGRTASLVVTITGAASGAEVRAMVFADARSFDRRTDAVAAFALVPRDGIVTATIDGLAPGPYAIAVFQDINGNRQLDTGFFGIPVEPYGFSNDAIAALGPPEFDDATITVGDAGLPVAIRLRATR